MYETIAEEAKKRGMSVLQLEKKAGLARSSITKWKTSSPNLDSLDKVADALGITTSTLVARAKKKHTE